MGKTFGIRLDSTIPTRSGARYQPQEDQSEESQDIEAFQLLFEGIDEERIHLDLQERFRQFRNSQSSLAREAWSTFRVAVEGHDFPYLTDCVERLKFLVEGSARLTQHLHVVIRDASLNISHYIENGDRQAALSHYHAAIYCVQEYERLIARVLNGISRLPRLVRQNRQHE